MAKKELVIKTKRLILQPMTDDEIKDIMKKTADEELKSAYKEMLDGCEKDAENRIWYAPWKICLKKEVTYIGDLGFKGPEKKNAVEIGYGILKEYEGNGYTTEAVKALTEWAFGTNSEIYFIEAETASDNTASKKILEKLGFVDDGEGENGLRYVQERAEVSWMSIYMCFGLSIGMSLGMGMNKMSLGMCLGMGIGLCIGAAMDASFRKNREEIRRKRAEEKKDFKGEEE